VYTQVLRVCVIDTICINFSFHQHPCPLMCVTDYAVFLYGISFYPLYVFCCCVGVIIFVAIVNRPVGSNGLSFLDPGLPWLIGIFCSVTHQTSHMWAVHLQRRHSGLHVQQPSLQSAMLYTCLTRCRPSFTTVNMDGDLDK